MFGNGVICLEGGDWNPGLNPDMLCNCKYIHVHVHTLIIIFPRSGVIGLICRPADFGTYFLFIMIANFLSSLIYYIVTKVTT